MKKPEITSISSRADFSGMKVPFGAAVNRVQNHLAEASAAFENYQKKYPNGPEEADEDFETETKKVEAKTEKLTTALASFRTEVFEKLNIKA